MWSILKNVTILLEKMCNFFSFRTLIFIGILIDSSKSKIGVLSPPSIVFPLMCFFRSVKRSLTNVAAPSFGTDFNKS